MSNVDPYDAEANPLAHYVRGGPAEITVTRTADAPKPGPSIDASKTALYEKLTRRPSVAGMSDALPVPDTPGEDKFDGWYKGRFESIEGDQELDQLSQTQHDAVALSNPLARPTPNVGDVWRSVKAFASQMSPIQPAGAAEASPTPDQADPLQWLLHGDKPTPPPEPGFLDQAWGIAGDIAKNMVLVPADVQMQLFGGARDAAQSAIDLINPLGDKLAAFMGSPDEPPATLPSIPEAKTVPGAIARGLAQFLIGWALTGKFLGAAGKGGSAVASGSRFLAQGAITDFTFFHGQDGKLADLIKDWPVIGRNAVTDYLATDPNDNEAEGRLKRALEGIVVAPLIPAFIATVRALRAWRAASKAGKMTGEALAGTPRQTVNLLGSEGEPLTARVAAPSGKIKGAAKEAQPGVPDEVLAKSFTDRGLTPLGVKGGPRIFANFAAVKTPEDIQRIANDMAEAFEGATDAARRGAISWSKTATAGKNLDAFGELMARRAGDAPTAAQVYAWRSLYEGSLTKLQEVARLAAAAPTPENLMQMRQMQALTLAIQKDFYGARAEAGRALNAFRMPTGSRASDIESLLNTYGGLDMNADMARKLGALSDANSASKFLEKTTFAKTRDAITQWFYFSILSSPRTHMRNIISNTGMIPLTMSETALAARLGKLLGTEDAVLIGEATAQWQGVMTGWKRALLLAAKAARTGESGYGAMQKMNVPNVRQNAISAEAWGLRKGGMVGRAVDALGAVTQTSGRALMTADEFFKGVGYDMSRFQQAYRQAQKEVAAGTLKPEAAAARMAAIADDLPEEMANSAALQAAYQTFTDAPTGEIVKAILKLRAIGTRPDSTIGSKAFGMTMRLLIPFVNTPVNIFKATFERTPLAPLTQRYRSAIAAGGGAADLARTKMALGSMIMFLSIDMGVNGDITGGGPSDPGALAALRRTGWQPYSIRVGGKYVSYQGIEPLSTVLGWGAGLGEWVRNSDMNDPAEQQNYEKVLASTIFSLADNVMSKSYLSSFSDAVAAINDPVGNGAYFFKKYGASLLVPNFVRDIKSTGDPVLRYTDNVIEEARSRVPGLSKSLPARRDAWGREISFASGFGSAYDAVSPFYVSKGEAQPIDLAMQKDGWYIGLPSKSITINKERVSLQTRLDIFSRYLELQGQTKPSEIASSNLSDRVTRDAERLQYRYGDRNLLDTLNAIVTGKADELSDRYKELDDAEDRERYLKGIVNDYRSAARGAIVVMFPELTVQAEAQMKATADEPQYDIFGGAQ